MTSFLEDIKFQFGAEAASHTASLLGAMGLPDAAPGQYLAGEGHDLLFLDRFGLVLRTGAQLGCPAHDLILRPLWQTSFSYYNMTISVEILPGIEAGLRSRAEMTQLATALAHDGIAFFDAGIENASYLPGGVPVVLDRGAVRQRHQQDMQSAFNKAGSPDRQSRIFKPLTDCLRGCWPENNEVPQPGTLRPFLARCAAETAKAPDDSSRLLSNQWDKNCSRKGGKPSLVVTIANAYEKRITWNQRRL